jgi:hypothetical protein
MVDSRQLSKSSTKSTKFMNRMFKNTAFGIAAFICGIFLTGTVFCQSINLTGTVQNSVLAGISGVQVSLKNHPAIQTATDASGNFTLTGNITGIDVLSQSEAISFPGNGIIYLNVLNEPVTIDIYNVAGQHIYNIVNNKQLFGQFKVYASAYVQSDFNIYFVRVIIGNEVKGNMFISDCANCIKGIIDMPAVTPIHTLKSEITGIDALVLTHNNYKTKEIELAGYNTSLGIITMEAMAALDYNFTGGTLDDLKAVNSSLTFGYLTISGKLDIPSSEGNVTLTVTNLDVNGYINVSFPICAPYYDGPNLTINATGTVNINSPIDMSGKSGESESSSTTCHDCTGTDGGDLTINAQTINVNNYLQTYGGQGAQYYYDASFKIGCDGGDGGNMSLLATNSLTIYSEGADLDIYGGDGGLGYGGGSNGVKGADGILRFGGNEITVYEIGGDLNMYRYNAQNLDYKKMTVIGQVSSNEESNHRNNYDAWYIKYDNGNIDWLEDLYSLTLSSASTITLSLSATNAQADLDLFILSDDMQTIIGLSNGSTSNESITTAILPAGRYVVAVSYSDDCIFLASTNYSLKFKY